MQARIAIGCTAVVSILLILTIAKLNWPVLGLYVPIQDVANVLAPLILTAAFIERAVEVIISPFRDPEATELRRKLAILQATKPMDSASVEIAEAKLNVYTGETQKYAFCALFLLGLCAAFVGIRALNLFLIQPGAPKLSGADLASNGQINAFHTFDVFVSALLLAGGANGLHAPINALTSFFNNNANKSLQSDATPAGAALPQTSNVAPVAANAAAQAQADAAQAIANAAQGQADAAAAIARGAAGVPVV